MKRPAIVTALIVLLTGHTICWGQGQTPARAILFIIDAVHYQAPERLGLESMKRLAAAGTSFRRAYCIAPDHPTTGPYGKLHTTSLPNPTLQSGTLFIRPDTKMVQECFWPKHLTAHGVNLTAYRSLNRGFHYSMMLDSGPDQAVVDWGVDLLRKADVHFARLHLQGPGTAGSQCAKVTDDVPWRRDIWGEGSPYVAALRNADRLLGEFVEALRRMGKWDDTLLVVMADHGQARVGWHPPMVEDSWITPLIFVGPGVARGRALDVAEHIDVVPTICALMGVPPPCSGPGCGVVLDEIRADHSGKPPTKPRRVRTINTLIRDYRLLKAKLLVRAETDPSLERIVVLADRQFYGVDRVLDWHEAGTLDRLIETNRAVIKQLKQALRE